MLDGGEALIVPPDLEFALQTAKATEQFDALTPGRRKQLLWWITGANREATRQARIEKTVTAALVGKSALA